MQVGYVSYFEWLKNLRPRALSAVWEKPFCRTNLNGHILGQIEELSG